MKAKVKLKSPLLELQADLTKNNLSHIQGKIPIRFLQEFHLEELVNFDFIFTTYIIMFVIIFILYLTSFI